MVKATFFCFFSKKGKKIPGIILSTYLWSDYCDLVSIRSHCLGILLDDNPWFSELQQLRTCYAFPRLKTLNDRHYTITNQPIHNPPCRNTIETPRADGNQQPIDTQTVCLAPSQLIHVHPCTQRARCFRFLGVHG